MSVELQNIRATEGAREVAPDEGERFDLAGAHLTWKVKGEDSGYAFSVCEQTLAPGEGVPLHSHSSPEVFYILAGQPDFFRIVNGREDWVRCETGSTMILPPNSLHAFYNRCSEPCRVLGISTPLHQTFFDAVATANQRECFSDLPLPEAMACIAQIGLRHNMYFAPYEANTRYRPQGCQKENHLIDPDSRWVSEGRINWDELAPAVDHIAGALWINELSLAIAPS